MMIMMMGNYQVKPASNVNQLKLEEVEKVGWQVLAQSSQVKFGGSDDNADHFFYSISAF